MAGLGAVATCVVEIQHEGARPSRVACSAVRFDGGFPRPIYEDWANWKLDSAFVDSAGVAGAMFKLPGDLDPGLYAVAWHVWRSDEERVALLYEPFDVEEVEKGGGLVNIGI